MDVGRQVDKRFSLLEYFKYTASGSPHDPILFLQVAQAEYHRILSLYLRMKLMNSNCSDCILFCLFLALFLVIQIVH
jgi:hypothetical protein